MIANKNSRLSVRVTELLTVVGRPGNNPQDISFPADAAIVIARRFNGDGHESYTLWDFDGHTRRAIPWMDVAATLFHAAGLVSSGGKEDLDEDLLEVLDFMHDRGLKMIEQLAGLPPEVRLEAERKGGQHGMRLW